ncbi:hypothetical protein ACRALDRAFT_207599 [Sodiomyces alcalophilus JCM 7366]|uniref:uncharacterized protein n=1 Tax=Sodiomyces alcalophilus JCM 7366 TaxID=591952 RepID=UPI0039B59E2A
MSASGRPSDGVGVALPMPIMLYWVRRTYMFCNYINGDGAAFPTAGLGMGFRENTSRGLPNTIMNFFRGSHVRHNETSTWRHGFEPQFKLESQTAVCNSAFIVHEEEAAEQPTSIKHLETRAIVKSKSSPFMLPGLGEEKTEKWLYFHYPYHVTERPCKKNLPTPCEEDEGKAKLQKETKEANTQRRPVSRHAKRHFG